MYTYTYVYMYMYICIYVYDNFQRFQSAGRAKSETWGVRKGGFSKGGLSNLCVIIVLLLLSPPLLNPLL